MKVKLPSPEGKVITMSVDKKIAQKCYEYSLRSMRGTYMVATRGEPDIEIDPIPYMDRRPRPVRVVREIEINGKKFKLEASLYKELRKNYISDFKEH